MFRKRSARVAASLLLTASAGWTRSKRSCAMRDSTSSTVKNPLFVSIFISRAMKSGGLLPRISHNLSRGVFMESQFRRDPEQLLKEIERQEQRERRGRLKIFLGYASGVGKSTKMLAGGLGGRGRGEEVDIRGVSAACSAGIERVMH